MGLSYPQGTPPCWDLVCPAVRGARTVVQGCSWLPRSRDARGCPTSNLLPSF